MPPFFIFDRRVNFIIVSTNSAVKTIIRVVIINIANKIGKILFFIILSFSIIINLVAFIAEKVMKKRMAKIAKQTRNEEK